MLQIQQYTSSGLLPIEAILDIKYMTLFNNICRQHDDAIEKQLETRQLNIKTTESKSWFTILKKILIKYDFSNINKGNNKITELRTIFQRESQNS